MPDGALLVNAARGPVADTEALVAELAHRPAAAPRWTSPIRSRCPPTTRSGTLPNVLLTPHVAGSVRGLLPRAYRLVGDQVRRFAAGQPLINTVVDGY